LPVVKSRVSIKKKTHHGGAEGAEIRILDQKPLELSVLGVSMVNIFFFVSFFGCGIAALASR
jgi:hypothetical protein